ncbi:MAG: ribonuclease P protein component [Acidobacteria bacterium]|nr:MAG: ribonuclease P protein component [Acidobacteriota bacterium]PYS12010.1 MAG: ribonuclease P protein component [Acidobacteriota bacterium]
MSLTNSNWRSPVAKTNAFRKDFRLRKSAEFENTYTKGVRKASRSFVVFVLPNNLGYSRFGLTTPRRLGRAHDRNKIRRRVREILRTSRRVLLTGVDIVVNPRGAALSRNFDELRLELMALLGTGG